MDTNTIAAKNPQLIQTQPKLELKSLGSKYSPESPNACV